MAKPPKPGSQPSFTVIYGELHKDHWTSGRMGVRVAPLSESRIIRISLWNPYYGKAYLNNHVEVWLDTRKVFSDKMLPAASAVIDYALTGGESLEIELKSEARMVPDPLDPRERGIIVRLTQEPVQA